MRRNRTAPFLLDQLRCLLTRACPGFLPQPHSTTEQNSQLGVLWEPPAIPGNLAHGRLQKRTRGRSQGQGGLQLTPQSAQTLAAGLSSQKRLPEGPGAPAPRCLRVTRREMNEVQDLAIRRDFMAKMLLRGITSFKDCFSAPTFHIKEWFPVSTAL